ncbi:MAG: FAD-dependent oxidoreductase, partial [Alphaproteobacteria bacterium]|nr:FAD-dependent oxidoreductase [Alphaproteobacteria bacterium]
MTLKITVPPLPAEPGPAAWNALLPEPAAPRVLAEKRTADWLVIGAGFAGLAAATRLSQLRPDDTIVILEALRVAEGPAGRNSGFMIDLPHDLTSEDYGGALESDRAQTRANRAAIDFAQAMAEEAELSAEAFNRCGKINGAATDKGHQHNLDYAKHLENLGEAYQMLDAHAMRQLTGIEYYKSGLFTPGSAMIQPALYVRSLA